MTKRAPLLAIIVELRVGIMATKTIGKVFFGLGSMLGAPDLFPMSYWEVEILVVTGRAFSGRLLPILDQIKCMLITGFRIKTMAANTPICHGRKIFIALLLAVFALFRLF